jgi:hypothetical protein
MFTRTVLTVGLIGFAFAPAAKADTYGHIEGLAHRLDQNISLLDREFTTHYRHTPEYRHLRSDSREMVQLARHIHEWAHAQGDVRHLESDLRQLDRLFHHVEDLVDDLEHNAAFEYDHGSYGWHGYGRGFGGHVHGDTNHVQRLMLAVEDTLHHLQDDLRSLSGGRQAPFAQPYSPVPPAANPGWGAYPGAVRGQPGPSIRFSHPGFSIWLGR